MLLSWSPISPESVAAISAGLDAAGGALPQVAPLSEWVKGLVPANPLRAAVEDAMVPLVVFALLFGFAAARLRDDMRDRLVGFFEALAEAMLVLVHWVLLVGPVGVFALAFALGVRVGLGAAGALLHYVLVIVAICLLLTLSVYVLVILARLDVRAFARAAAAGQAVGFSTQSSLAALPAMVEGAQQHLGVPSRVTGLVLPLAVSLFRYHQPRREPGRCAVPGVFLRHRALGGAGRRRRRRRRGREPRRRIAAGPGVVLRLLRADQHGARRADCRPAAVARRGVDT